MDKKEKISSEQLFDIITKEEISWQSVIYELVKTERLDPWNIDISLLADKYLEKIKQMEEANFFVSSKMLLACSILLKMKSEILNNNFLKSMDELIYGKKEEKKELKKLDEFFDQEIPILTPRTPLPRQKKLTLNELLSALNKAIETETRRIRRFVGKKNAEKITSLFLPKNTRISLKERINLIIKEIEKHFKELNKKEITFSDLAKTRDEKISFFLPLLQLDNHQKIYIKQYNHFEEIFISLEKYKEEDIL
ncbi:MAG: segregation/condensation protein A [Candidatus Pacearchaeota archaeon]